MRFELSIGIRYFRSRRRARFVSMIAFISLAGVALGTFALTVVMSVMSGFEKDLRQRLLAFNPHITVESSPEQKMRFEAVMQQVRSVSGVVAAAPFLSAEVLVAAGGAEGGPGYVTGAVARGVPPRNNPSAEYLRRTIVAGSLASLSQSSTVAIGEGKQRRSVALPKLIIGQDLANQLGVRLGDVVTLISPSSLGGTALGGGPRLKRFVVGGIFRSGMSEYDGGLVIVALSNAQGLFEGDGLAERGLQVQVANLFAAPRLAHRLRHLLGRGYRVTDWTQSNRSLFAALRLEKLAYFLGLLLIVLVAAFNIIATLVMVVLERRREIAILRAMGAEANSVARIFMVQGTVFGLIGSGIGVVSGFAAAWAIQRYHLFRLPPENFIVSVVPVELDPFNFIAVGLSAVVLCTVAAVYPALKARKLSPVEVIRYE